MNKMQVVVCYAVENEANEEIEEVRIPGKVFDLDWNSDKVLAAIQSVVDVFENEGITIDQSGEDKGDLQEYTLDLPDYREEDDDEDVPENETVPYRLLEDVEAALTKLG